MRVSKTGLALSIAYVVFSIASALYGQAQADAKVSTFFQQLPLVPSFIVLGNLGVLEWFANTPWLLGYAICIPVTAAAIYIIVWLFGAAKPGVRLAIAVALIGLLGVATLLPR